MEYADQVWKEVSSSTRREVLLEKVRRKKETLLTEVDGFERGDKSALNAPHVDRAEGIALLLDMEFGRPVMTMQNCQDPYLSLIRGCP